MLKSQFELKSFKFPPPTTINPVTGNPYYQSRVNNYYHIYTFTDLQFQSIYNYFDDGTLTSSEANEIRDKIACELINRSLDIDVTAFITDISVAYNDDMVLCGCNGESHLNVAVKWGYHY